MERPFRCCVLCPAALHAAYGYGQECSEDVCPAAICVPRGCPAEMFWKDLESMKIIFTGKGGAGKTTITAWMADYLVRSGHDVLLVDMGMGQSLGMVSGNEGRLAAASAESAQARRKRSPKKGEYRFPREEGNAILLPDSKAPLLPGALRRGTKRLLSKPEKLRKSHAMVRAGELFKGKLDGINHRPGEFVLVDMEAGYGHLTSESAADVDCLVVLSEPSVRSLSIASAICQKARELGLDRQALILNFCPEGDVRLPFLPGMPSNILAVPEFRGLKVKKIQSWSVLDLPEWAEVDVLMETLLEKIKKTALVAVPQ